MSLFWEWSIWVALGYATNVMFYFAFCRDEPISLLARVLMPTLIVPFLPMLLISIVMIGIVVAMAIGTVLMGVVAIIIGVCGLLLAGKRLSERMLLKRVGDDEACST